MKNQIHSKTILLLIVCCFCLASAWAGNHSVKKGIAKKPMEYFKSQSVVTEPGEDVALYEGLPGDAASLAGIVPGVMAHIFMDPIMGNPIPEERKKEVSLRTVAAKLERIKELDSRPLKEARPFDKKLVSNCRDYSVLLCSMLRHQGIPARVRSGFATYFTPGKYEDHWIVEYWNQKENRWVRVDSQLRPEAVKFLKIDFNPLDVPQDKFITGSEMWVKCRKGEVDPELCGIQQFKGLWFVRGEMMRDMLCLNKLELLPWDCNELMKDDHKPTVTEYQLLDKAAELMNGGDKTFAAMQKFYQSHPAFQMEAGWKP
jgi:hypothetical protein